MIYKRTFGKRGLVAVLAYEPHLSNADIMAMVEGACLQCGITQEYALDMFIAENNPEITELGAQEMINHAATIINSGYKAVVTVGPQAWTALELSMEQLDSQIMHIGVYLEPYGDDEETFRVTNLAEMFEKNMTAEDRKQFADQLPPGLQEKRDKEAKRRERNAQIKAAGSRLVLGLRRPDGKRSLLGSYDVTDDLNSKDEDFFEA